MSHGVFFLAAVDRASRRRQYACRTARLLSVGHTVQLHPSAVRVTVGDVNGTLDMMLSWSVRRYLRGQVARLAAAALESLPASAQ
jgi:hypothetical protein